MKRDNDYNGNEKDNCVKQLGGGGVNNNNKNANILGNLQKERGEGEGQN